MAIGRYHVRRLSLTASPGWRRAKSLDNFRHRAPQIQEAVFLDDPSRDKIDLADMKSFLTADEDHTCSGRYSDVRLVRNGMRAYASNDIGEGDEPEDTYRSDIEPDEFFKLLRKTFPESKQADVLAVLKRTIVMVFGQNGLYLRFPSPNYGALVHRIVADDVHKDLPATKDKPVYAAYKLGDMVKGSYYESEVEKEQKIIDEGMMKLQQAGRAQDYVERCNKDLKEALKQVARIPESSFVPTSESSEDPPLLPPVPLNIGCNAPKRLREGDFTTQTPSRTSASGTKRACSSLAGEEQPHLLPLVIHNRKMPTNVQSLKSFWLQQKQPTWRTLLQTRMQATFSTTRA